MISQHSLGNRFFAGHKNGAASNVKIESFPDLGLTALIGYGWAVYATRDTDTGFVTYYNGWYGYSPSTSCQLTKLGLYAADTKTGGRLERGELRRAAKQERRAGVACP